MSNFAKATLTAAIALATLPAVSASAAEVSTFETAAGSVMFFDGTESAAYYKIDQKQFKTTVVVTPHSALEGVPMRFVDTLQDGESTDYTLGMTRDGTTTVHLNLKRDGDKISANIVTDSKPDYTKRATQMKKTAQTRELEFANYRADQTVVQRGTFQ